jgi:hypothetical protein
METCKDLGHGWVQRTAPKQVGTFKRAGTHTIAECRGGKFFICTREPASQDGEDSTVLCEALTTGQYNFDISVKPCAIANANRTHQRVHIIFGYRSPSQFLCLTQDADQNMWRIDAFRDEQQNNGRATLLVNVEDNMLRANRFSKVTIHCRGNVVAVTVGNRTLIQGLVVKDATQLCGAVGIACMRSKMIFKDAAVTTVAGGAKRRANNGTYGAGGGGGGGGGGNQPPEARTRRDGSLMLPERMMRGASEAGLGNMEGGAYGHMRSLRGARIEEGSQQRDLGVSGHHQKGNQGNQGNDSRNRKEESRLVHGEKAPFVGDDRYLIDMIERDIINRQLGVKFEDIAGLEDAKRLLNEVSKYIFFSVSVSVSVCFCFCFCFFFFFFFFFFSSQNTGTHSQSRYYCYPTLLSLRRFLYLFLCRNFLLEFVNLGKVSFCMDHLVLEKRCWQKQQRVLMISHFSIHQQRRWSTNTVVRVKN